MPTAIEKPPSQCETRDAKGLLTALEVPFPPELVQWRVTNTSNDKKRGQIIAYADPRAYTDRLNHLFSPQGWTRNYHVETMNNITRMKRGEAIITGKVLVTCTVTINGIGEHSGTGEEWADDDNGMTAADAQAFKRACSCFGLGRYFYYFQAPWVDLDDHRQPREFPRYPLGRYLRTGERACGQRRRNGNGHATHAGNGNGGMTPASGGTGRTAPGMAMAAAEPIMATWTCGSPSPKRWWDTAFYRKFFVSMAGPIKPG